MRNHKRCWPDRHSRVCVELAEGALVKGRLVPAEVQRRDDDQEQHEEGPETTVAGSPAAPPTLRSFGIRHPALILPEVGLADKHGAYPGIRRGLSLPRRAPAVGATHGVCAASSMIWTSVASTSSAPLRSSGLG